MGELIQFGVKLREKRLREKANLKLPDNSLIELEKLDKELDVKMKEIDKIINRGK